MTKTTQCVHRVHLKVISSPGCHTVSYLSWGSLQRGSPDTANLSPLPLPVVLIYMYWWSIFEGKLVLKAGSGVLLPFFFQFLSLRSITVHLSCVCESTLSYQEPWFFLIADSQSKHRQNTSPHSSQWPVWASVFSPYPLMGHLHSALYKSFTYCVICLLSLYVARGRHYTSAI